MCILNNHDKEHHQYKPITDIIKTELSGIENEHKHKKSIIINRVTTQTLPKHKPKNPLIILNKTLHKTPVVIY